jgi:hypothetical protein
MDKSGKETEREEPKSNGQYSATTVEAEEDLRGPAQPGRRTPRRILA